MNYALGTVQFGMKYGISNEDDETSIEEVKSILELCKRNKIDTLDTAINYGSSETKLGLASVKDFKVVSKIPPIDCTIDDVSSLIKVKLLDSLKRLKIDKMYGILLHRSADLQSNNKKEIITSLNNLKADGLVEKIGCSIYSPDELNFIFNSLDVDIIQAPLNLLDRRLIDSGWLSKLKINGVEIHSRSTFLQGLLLMSKQDIPSSFNHSKKIFEKWFEFINKNNISQLSACLSFVRSINEIDKILIGVQNSTQLMEIINTKTFDMKSLNTEFMNSKKLNLIDPSKW